MERRTIAIIVIVTLVLSIALVLALCVRSVKTGYTGILLSCGRVEDTEMTAGVHFKAPWQRIVQMDNRAQKVELKTSTFSSDIQQVDLALSINYSIDKATARKLYATVGEKYYDTIILPRILENTKSVFAHYNAETLIESRQELSRQIKERLQADLSEYGIVVINFAVEDIDFTDAFTNAVEAKQVAQQNRLTAETQQEQKTMEQRAAAERRVIDAEAAAEVARIQAEADLEVTKIQADAAEYAGQKEAAKNKAISAYLTADLLKYYYILQWDGILPKYMTGSESTVFMLPEAE